MAFTQANVFREVVAVLADPDNDRWPRTQLNTFLSAAQYEIVRIKPTASAETTIVDLVAGTRQTLAALHSQILRVVRNIRETDPAVVGGPAVTPASRERLDALVPGWSDPDVYPYTANVIHFIQDPDVPEEFLVFPGNTGAGKLEIVISKEPSDLNVPDPDTSIASWTQTVPFEDAYRQPCVDYVLYRCFEIDQDLAGAGERAQHHLNRFLTALGARDLAEATKNVNRARPQQEAD